MSSEKLRKCNILCVIVIAISIVGLIVLIVENYSLHNISTENIKVFALILQTILFITTLLRFYLIKKIKKNEAKDYEDKKEKNRYKNTKIQ